MELPQDSTPPEGSNVDQAKLPAASDLAASILKIADDTKQRRISIEKDFEDVKTRIKNNKETLNEVQQQIEKVRIQLNKMKELTTKSENLLFEDGAEDLGAAWKQNEMEMDNVEQHLTAIEEDIQKSLLKLPEQKLLKDDS